MSLTAEVADPGLRALLEEAFRLLGRGVADRRSPCHTPCVATAGEGGAPQARIVVLRAFNPAVPALRFHTDVRSPKWSELVRKSDLALLFYDPGTRVQIRVDAVASLHSDDAVADVAWATAQAMSRICYGSTPAPGSLIGEGGAFTLPNAQDDIEAGRVNFGAVLCRVARVDVLHLAHTGHRRAAYSFREGGVTAAGWLAP